MTADQGLAFGILAGMMGLFVWGRLRYDLVALVTLLAAVAAGIVPVDRAFAGFSDDVVLIVGAALVVSAAVARAGIAERLLRPIAPALGSVRLQVIVLVGAVTALSAFVKNVGALAILMPVALQQARRAGTPASYVLMPLAFGSLLGGLITLVGTSPNIIVARMRGEIVGEPFAMFDFAPVGLGLAVAGVAFLAVGYRLLPAGRRGAAGMDAAFAFEGYVTEARLPAASPLVGKTVAELEALSTGEVAVTTIIREEFRRYTPAGHWTLFEGDILLLQGEAAALEGLVGRARLELVTERDGEPGEAAAAAAAPTEAGEEARAVVEAVVTGDSPLVDRSPSGLRLRERHGVTLLAVSRSGARVSHRLRSLRFKPGDVLVLQGRPATLPETLGELRCLPLAGRDMPLGSRRRGLGSAAILGAAILAVAFHLVPVHIAFVGAAVAMVLFKVLPLADAYGAIEWPILVLLGALIPVSEAMRATGATDLIAGWLASTAAHLPPTGALALVMAVAMAVTPFLNNAATVLIMAPVAASLAGGLGYGPDPFLMAVAVGAACDFLTPIGHQCNTLVMGPGGYRFGDYWRLGLPLTLIVLTLGTFLISVFWPLAAGAPAGP